MKAFGEGVRRGESASRGVSGVMNREAATAAGDARIRVQSFDRTRLEPSTIIISCCTSLILA